MTPNGTTSNRVTMASFNEAHSAVGRKSITGARNLYDCPKSPVNALPAQRKYRSMSGPSRPSSAFSLVDRLLFGERAEDGPPDAPRQHGRHHEHDQTENERG